MQRGSVKSSRGQLSLADLERIELISQLRRTVNATEDRILAIDQVPGIYFVFERIGYFPQFIAALTLTSNSQIDWGNRFLLVWHQCRLVFQKISLRKY